MKEPWEEHISLEYLKSFPIYWFRRNFIDKNIIVTRGMKILEAGSGPAHDSIIFAEKGADITAVDSSKNAVRSAIQIYSSLGYHIKTARANLRTLPFRNDFFDIVWNAGVLEHFEREKDLEKACSEMVRVTKRKGMVLIFVPNKYYFWYQQYLKKKKNRQYEFERALSVFELKKLFKKFRLKNIRVSGIHVYPAFSYIIPKTKLLTKACKRLFAPLENTNRFGFLKSLIGLDIVVSGVKK